jgi:phosphoribosylamine--glycine ligase
MLKNFGIFTPKTSQKMNILLIGGGGREHCMAWKMKQSPLVNEIFIAPGNAGTLKLGTNLNINIADFNKLTEAAIRHSIDMIVVGPEEPLVKGIYDTITSNPKTKHIKVIGPSQDAAKLEGSKAFAKQFMQRHQIPTAAYREFTYDNFEEGLLYIKNQPLPIVLKADGLAGGKGVVICQNHLEAATEYEMMIKEGKFGIAGNKVVVEDFLSGIEFSLFVITDGKHYKILPVAKDYKRVGEGDTGLNTGGMGAVSPVPFVDATMMQKVEERIIKPTIEGLSKDGLVYHGFVFFGLISVQGEPFVIEYNCRLGDPETEVVLPRLKNDLVDIFQKLSQGRLAEVAIEEDDRAAATIVAISGGYPSQYSTGYEITGLDTVQTDTVFLAGAKTEDGKILTDGGRVAAVTSLDTTLSQAVINSQRILTQIDFEDMYYRSDIGYEFIN